ncbi:MAG: glucosyltransferase domain-containing protein [Oscillospiraceae bacterium]|nr:glucosyltransferase domain-containing protein [Oscillospiraceae bacterium]
MIQMLRDKTKNRTVIFSCTAFLLLAHLYRWTNEMFNHDSLLIYQWDHGWQISLGRIFNPVYLMIRGKIAAPLLVAVLGGAFLTLSVVVCCHVLSLQKKSSLVLCAGLLTTFETITFLNATFLPYFDLFMLALLFAALAAFFLLSREMRPAFRFLLAVCCGAASLGLYQSYIEVTILLVILSLLRDLLDGESARSVFLRGVYAVAGLLTAGAVYYLCLRLVWSHTGISPENSYNSLSLMRQITAGGIPRRLVKTWLFPFRYLLRPETAHRRASSVIHVMLFLFLLWEIFRRLAVRRADAASVVLTLFLLGVLPLGCNVVYVLSNGLKHGLMTYSFAFYAVWGVMLYDDPPGADPLGLRRWKSIGVSLLCGVLIFNHVIFANQVYLVEELEAKAGFSFMTRLVDRMEQTEGYRVGETKVAILGYIDESPLSHEREKLHIVNDNYIGTLHHLAMSYYDTFEEYFEFILGYPVNIVPLEDLPELMEDPAVKEMPIFPDPGAVAMVGDTLVVRLSKDLRPQDMRFR